MAQGKRSTRLRVPRHLVLPLVMPDDSYMSRTYSSYLQGARNMLDNGVPLAEILGADDEMAVDLFFRPRSDGDTFDCASWACEVCRSYENDVFARLASAYLLTIMMRVSRHTGCCCDGAETLMTWSAVAFGPDPGNLSKPTRDDAANSLSVHDPAHRCHRDHTNVRRRPYLALECQTLILISVLRSETQPLTACGTGLRRRIGA